MNDNRNLAPHRITIGLEAPRLKNQKRFADPEPADGCGLAEPAVVLLEGGVDREGRGDDQ
jgi:hypothetical protein